MNMLELMFAANTQPVDVFGPIIKSLGPLLVLAFIIKIATLFIPTKKKRQDQSLKVANEHVAIQGRNLIPCQDCKGLISPKASACPHCGAPIDPNYVRGIEEKKREIADKERAARVAEKAIVLLAKMMTVGTMGLIVIVCAIAFGSGVGMIIWICIGLLLMALSAIRIYAFLNKGKMGELLVMARLRKGLPESHYEILNNIYLPIDDGATTQIDHVVVSRFGVFVVETKNYSGWIFADASSKVWTQTIYHTKNTFQNPILQNYRHVCAIAENLGLPKEYIRGVVAFTGNCEFKTPMPDGVVYSRQLANYIKSFSSPILKEREKEDVIAALREWDASVTPEQRSAHVANLKRRHN